MKFDYSFFEEITHHLRKLRSHSIDKSYLLDAPSQIFPEMELGMAPRALEGTEDDPSQLILTRSYARKPGGDLDLLEKALQNRLPEDFLEFYKHYNEALITTRTYPIHLWNEEKMLTAIDDGRDLYPYPLRFFRFGEYWDRYELWFGLWQVDPENNIWKVVITSHDQRDDDLDSGTEDEYILGGSFYDWLKDFIERDGIPDRFMTRFGILDPA